MLSNHPHIAAQLAEAHRDDLLRQADRRRLRRFARAAKRAESAGRADRADQARQADRRAEDPRRPDAGPLDEGCEEAPRPVIEAEPAPLPGPAR